MSKPTTMSLKGFWKDRRGNSQGFWYKLKDFGWQLRYAWERAWHGYDSVDVIDPGRRTCERLQIILPEFYKNHHEYIDAPEVDTAVLKIVDLLGYIDDERSYSELYSDMPLVEQELLGIEFEDRDYPFELMVDAERMTEDKLLEAFTLLGENIRRLWY
jgi:hypothetical protein